MTTDEFNEKYEKYLEPNFYGLAIEIPEVVQYLDEEFESLINIPNFSYSQIKLKFNFARVYLGPADNSELHKKSYEIEKKIDSIIADLQIQNS
jgi:hypothetical protein